MRDSVNTANAETKLQEILKKSPASPFLFIGAGFSRRYIGLPNWSDLLAHFCQDIKNFHYYFSSSSQDLTRVASMMAEDFHELFWAKDSYEALRRRVGARLTSPASALKYAIAEFVEKKSLILEIPASYKEELEALGKLNVDGIITTNWDTFLEQKFPDYKVYVGQDDLFYSDAQGICEIYKIHGCVSKPETLILTAEDYEKFNAKNAYLAAKLTTIFMEHPIFFMGYALKDPNIVELLCSMAKCMGDKISLLQDNLIFVEWDEGSPLTIEKNTLVVEKRTIPITLIKTDSFLPVFNVLALTKHKIPAKILRHCRESIYNLVRESASQEHKNICCVGLDEIEDVNDIDFVVGLGVISQLNLGGQGYAPITAKQVFHDVLFDDGNFNANQLVSNTIIPHLTKGRKYLPIFKYLQKMGIEDRATYNLSDLSALSKFVDTTNYRNRAYARPFVANAAKCSLEDIISKFDDTHAVAYLAYAKITQDNFPKFEQYLQKHFDEFYDSETTAIKQEYRKLICRYDRMKFGWTEGRGTNA